jgi:hypothetical protein
MVHLLGSASGLTDAGTRRRQPDTNYALFYRSLEAGTTGKAFAVRPEKGQWQRKRTHGPFAVPPRLAKNS